MYKHLSIMIIMSLMTAIQMPAQKLNIAIEGLRNNKGQIILNIYTNSQSFKKEEPDHIYFYQKSQCKKGKMVIDNLEIPTGFYGIVLIDDENCNKKLDFKLIVPQEGFAFSNYPFSQFRKPNFEAFSFEHLKSTFVLFEVYYFTDE